MLRVCGARVIRINGKHPFVALAIESIRNYYTSSWTRDVVSALLLIRCVPVGDSRVIAECDIEAHCPKSGLAYPWQSGPGPGAGEIAVVQ